MRIRYSKLFVGISLPALCTGLASLLLFTSANAQTIRPSTQKELKVFDPTTNGTGNIGLRAAAGTSSYTLTLPASAPSVNQVLSASAVTGGNVSLTWATPFTGSGTTNYVSKFATAGTLTNSLLFDNGTNVGIGTTSPFARTTISRNGINVDTISTSDATNNSHLTLSGADSFVRLQFGTYNNGSYASWIQSSFDNGGVYNGLKPLAINPQGGNVGIGTTSPGSTLDVKGTLRLSGATSGYVGIAPAAAAGSTTYTLPSTTPSVNQVLSASAVTGGNVSLTWATPVSGTVTSVATNNGSGITGGTITTSGTLAIDTLLISTRAWRKKGIDSVQANLTAGLATKLNISDTASMLSPYARTNVVNAGLALKVNISDTASMLSPYLRKIDTASLSNRINTKLNISDTSSMLTNYLNNVGYGLLRTGQVARADSATLANYFLRRKDSLTSTNLLGYVTRKVLADTAAAIRSADAGGTVTSVATNTGTGITGGTITTSGTIAADTLLLSTRAWRQKGVDSVASLINTRISGTTNYLPKFTSSSAIGNSLIQEASGMIGINVSPVAELQVGKSSDVLFALSNSTSVTSGNRGGISWFNSSNSTVANIRATAVTDNVGTQLEFYTRPAAGSLTQAMTLNASGILAVGGTPNTYSADYKIQIGAESGNTGLVIRMGSSSIGKLSFDRGANGDGIGRIWYDASNNSMQFYTSTNGTNSFEALRLASTGAATFSSSVTASSVIIPSYETATNVLSFRSGIPDGTNVGIRAKAMVTGNVHRDGLEILGYNGIDFTIFNGATVAMRVNNLGKVGIGTTSPSEALDVNGNARFRSVASGTVDKNLSVTNDGTLTVLSSDLRLKTNITTIDNALEKVMKLRGVNFNWKDTSNKVRSTGFIAQEVLSVMPELVFRNNFDGYYGVNYGQAAGLFVEAIKEQQKIIDQLKADQVNALLQLRQLQNEIQSMRKNQTPHHP